MGYQDIANKLWIIPEGRGLTIEGFPDEIAAIGHLIRRRLSQHRADPSVATAEVAAELAAEVVRALQYLDPKPRSCNMHSDCDAADAAAKICGVRVDHCHDECCEDCFGS